jgi:hypothetical protein
MIARHTRSLLDGSRRTHDRSVGPQAARTSHFEEYP